MPQEIRSILAATDLSRPAQLAVRRAALIAHAHGARLELLHVLGHSFASDAWREMRGALGLEERRLREAIEAQLREAGARVAAEHGVAAATHVAEGKPFAEIAARAQALEADLVVVGAHGENALLDAFLGTTAHRVLRYAQAPVLLVKQAPEGPYKSVVVGTDFSADAVRAAACAQQLCGAAAPALLHALELPFEGKLRFAGVEDALVLRYREQAVHAAHRRLAAFAAAAGIRDGARVVRHGPAPTRIRELAREMDADLIALGAEGEPALQAAVLGGVSLRVVTEAHCDVLLARRIAAE